VGDPVQRSCLDRPVAVEEYGGKAGSAQ